MALTGPLPRPMLADQIEAHQAEYANVENEVYQIVKAYQEVGK